MSKAEDLAKELFPLLETDKIGNNPYITYNTKQLAKREGYIEGYHQAEKDLELGWKDIKIILDIENNILRECNSQKELVIETYQKGEDYYGEILKRFKEMKVK